MRASTGNTGHMPRRPTVRSIKQSLGNDVGDMLYNSSVQPTIPLYYPRTLPLYTSERCITKSAEEPGGCGGVCTPLCLIPQRMPQALV